MLQHLRADTGQVRAGQDPSYTGVLDRWEVSYGLFLSDFSRFFALFRDLARPFTACFSFR